MTPTDRAEFERWAREEIGWNDFRIVGPGYVNEGDYLNEPVAFASKVCRAALARANEPADVATPDPRRLYQTTVCNECYAHVSVNDFAEHAEWHRSLAKPGVAQVIDEISRDATAPARDGKGERRRANHYRFVDVPAIRVSIDGALPGGDTVDRRKGGA